MNAPPKDPVQRFYRLILGLLGLGFLYVVWPFIANVVLLLVFAFLFTTILLPPVDWLEGRLKSRGLAVLTAVVTLLAAVIVFVSSFGVQLSSEAMATYRQFDQQEMIKAIDELRGSLVARLPKFAQDIVQARSEGVDSADKISQYVNQVLHSLAQLTSAIGSFLFSAVMMLIFTVILLFEYHNFKRALVSFIPNKYFELGIRLIRNTEKQVSSYLHGQLLAAASVGIMSIIGLLLLNVLVGANLTLIVFIGAIAGIANLIPLVGP
ncbi:MAG: AI-2E family transporter, partial [Fidelibacterota bacterium]